MGQYLTRANGEYYEYLDTSTGMYFRVGQRDHYVVYDKEIVVGGFLLAENVGWINIGGFGDLVTGSNIRMGVRNGNWQIDISLTALEFTGAENTDWINIGSINII